MFVYKPCTCAHITINHIFHIYICEYIFLCYTCFCNFIQHVTILYIIISALSTIPVHMKHMHSYICNGSLLSLSCSTPPNPSNSHWHASSCYYPTYTPSVVHHFTTYTCRCCVLQATVTLISTDDTGVAKRGSVWAAWLPVHQNRVTQVIVLDEGDSTLARVCTYRSAFAASCAAVSDYKESARCCFPTSEVT